MSRLRIVATTIVVLALLAATTVVSAQEQETEETESVEMELQDREEIQRSIQEILARSEFRRLDFRKLQEPWEPTEPTLPEWLKRLIESLRPLFVGIELLLAPLSLGMQILILVLIAAVCLLIIWLVVRALAGWKTIPVEGGPPTEFDEGEEILAPGELPGDVYLRRAEKLAADGRFVEAISQLLTGAMGFVERRGWIRFRPGLTHRDYLRATRRKQEPHADLRAMVAVFEPLSFGRRTARSEHFQTSLQHYMTSFHET